MPRPASETNKRRDDTLAQSLKCCVESRISPAFPPFQHERGYMGYKTSKKDVSRRLGRLGLDDAVEIVSRSLEANKYSSGDRRIMWKEQVLVNFPLLYLASIVFYQFAKERGCNTFLFATRDGCHWHRIFRALFPETVVHYFESSRIMLENGHKNDHYNDYVARLLPTQGEPTKMVYVDIHGTGSRMFSYFEHVWRDVPYCFLLTAREYHVNDFPESTQYWSKAGKLRVLGKIGFKTECCEAKRN